MREYVKFTDNPKRKQLIEAFKIPERDGKVFASLDEAVKEALERAFRDINFRTLSKKTPLASALNGETQITKVLINELEKAHFITEFIEYFDKGFLSEESFDKWHHKACRIFLGVLRTYYSDAQYGKAQKIVNMMFKHLYCMNFGKNEEQDKADWVVLNENYFTHCHLTLDSFTLEWFCREVAENWYNKKAAKAAKDKIRKGKIESWSNLRFVCTGYSRAERHERDVSTRTVPQQMTKPKEDKYHYMFFVDTIRQFFSQTQLPQPAAKELTAEQKKYSEYSPFEAEFYIWPDIQLHLTAEALFGQSIAQEESIADLENETGKKFKDFNEAKKYYKVLDRKTKVAILKKKIEHIQNIW